MTATFVLPLGRVKYHDYIQSERWRAVRSRYWQSGRPRVCYVCKQPWQQGYHMHHLTYERLGCEQLDDIVPVCPFHHEQIHRLQREHRLTIKQATELARENFERRRAAWNARPCDPPAPKPNRPWWQERRRLLKQARQQARIAEQARRKQIKLARKAARKARTG